MANQFEFLARAKPASIHKLLEKLPMEEAAIVLTGLPQALVVQVLAYFPDAQQATFLPAMREARQAPQQRKDETANRIQEILTAARNAKNGEQPPAKPAAPLAENLVSDEMTAEYIPPPVAPANPAPDRRQIVRPMSESPMRSAQRTPPPAKPPQPNKPNPYQQLAPNSSVLSSDLNKPNHPPPAEPPPSPFSGLGAKLKNMLMPSTPDKEEEPAPQPRRIRSELPLRSDAGRREPPPKPTRWVPRTATSSPINGPALPGKPPPVAGDPMDSPLAKRAGLLDLIGRAQQELLPKGSVPKQKTPQTPNRGVPVRRRADGRLEPVEGVVAPGRIEVGNTPRVIGPGMKKQRPAPGPAPMTKGARRMDGKAILAAILREASPEVRGQVEDDDPALFRLLRERMFYFDDLIYTEDAALARVFTAAPADTAALALKFAAPALRDRVLRVVSPGRAKALRDAPGKAGLDDIEAAQKQVLNVALQLQAAGRILIDPRDPDLAG